MFDPLKNDVSLIKSEVINSERKKLILGDADIVRVGCLSEANFPLGKFN